MPTAVLRVLGTAVLLFLSGCATSVETPLRRPQPRAVPLSSLRVAVLPPRIHPSLKPGNLKADQPLAVQLLDGRGMVVTSPTVSRDIALELVSTLTQMHQFDRIFTVENADEAKRLGADALLTVSVWDYRTVRMGSNKMYPFLVALGPLMPQYWIRWITLEARLEWEVRLDSLEEDTCLYRRRLKRQYTTPVRAASGRFFSAKMLSFLQNQAVPDFIIQLFEPECPEEIQEEAVPPVPQG